MKPDSTWNDAQLVIAYQQGTQEAWDILCVRHRKYLKGFFFRKGVTYSEDLKDLVQETFLEAMKNIDKVYAPDSFRVWLIRVATGTLSRWVRKQNRYRKIQQSIDIIANRTESCDVYVSTYLNPEQRAIDADYLRVILSLIDRLPPSEEKAILFHCNGMTNTEIAAEFQISVNAAKVRLSKAKKKLNEWIEVDYPEMHADLVARGIL